MWTLYFESPRESISFTVNGDRTDIEALYGLLRKQYHNNYMTVEDNKGNIRNNVSVGALIIPL